VKAFRERPSCRAPELLGPFRQRVGDFRGKPAIALKESSVEPTGTFEIPRADALNPEAAG
jgi:hypothetical protein